MNCAIEMYLLAAGRIFRYLQGTKEFRLFYKKGEKVNLFSFIDSDYTEDIDERKSIFKYIFYVGDRSCFMVIEEAIYCCIIIH